MTPGVKHPGVHTRRTAVIIIRAWTDEGSRGLRAHVVWQLDGDGSDLEARGADGATATTMIVENLLKGFEASQLRR